MIFDLEFVTFLFFYVIPAWGERESTLWIPACLPACLPAGRQAFAGMTTPGVAEGYLHSGAVPLRRQRAVKTA